MDLKSVWRTLLNQDDGSELVEFAFASLVFFAVLFGILYFSLAIFAAHCVTNAADDGARYAVVRGSSWNGTACQSVSSYDCTATTTDVTNYVLNTIPPGISQSKLSVSTSWPGTTSSGGTCDTENGANSPNCQVVVKVTYSLTLPFPLMGQRTLALSSSSSMTVAR